jgi:signal transduction histidine kinase
MPDTNIAQPHWMRGFLIFRRAALLIALGFATLDALQDDPILLASWRGVVLALLEIGFVAGYERFERTEPRQALDWPMAYRQVLRVTDDGSGVTSADLARPGHYGITGRRERVEVLGGRLRITARGGGGTIVEALVPIDVD